MIFSALVSFLGGSAFRFIIGAVTDWLKAKQEHAFEMDRMALQERIDQAASERQQALVKLQADLKLGEIKLVGETQVATAEAEAFKVAMEAANKPTGVPWVDAWNGTIRPMTATIAILLWLLSVIKAALVVTDWDKNLIASVFGYYFADRHIGKSRQ